MKSHQPSRYFLILFLVLSLALVACERPLRGDDGEDATVGEVVGDGIDAAIESADDTVDAAADAVEDAGDAAMDAAGDAADTAGDAVDAAVDVAEDAGDAAMDAAGDAVDAVVDVAEDAGDAAMDAAGDAVDAAGDAVDAAGDVGDAVVDAAEDVGDAVADAAEDVGEAVADAVTDEDQSPRTEGEGAETAPEATVTDNPGSHVVAPGETLNQIGLRYGISWVDLARYNNIFNANAIQVGQTLQIPPTANNAPEVVTDAPTNEDGEVVHVVQATDNLYRIGLQYGVSWVQIAEANGLVNPSQITVGQSLKIPTNSPGVRPEFTHTVQAGETLFLISLRYGISWAALAEANNLASPYVIYPGDALVIPGGE